MKNIGIVDRIFRLIGLHLVISLVDADLFETSFMILVLSIVGFYLLVTLLIGIDPIYKLFQLETVEPTMDNKNRCKY